MRGRRGAAVSGKLEILTEQDLLEKTVYTKALDFFMSREYAEVIKLLQPFYNEKYKTANPPMIELLARAHRESSNCLDYHKQFTLPLWKDLYAKQISQKQPDYEFVLTCLVEIIQCHLNDHKEREGYIKMALSILNKHERFFLVFDSRGRLVSDEKLRTKKCLIHFMIAVFRSDSHLRCMDAIEQKQYFDDAEKHYLLALKQVPGDLKTLVNFARLNATHSGAAAGINTLLPFKDQYTKDRGYNECMRKLYQKSGQHDFADIYKKRSDLSLGRDEMSHIFESSGKTLEDVPREKIRQGQQLLSEDKLTEAKLIGSELLEKYPNYPAALDLMLRIELTLKNTPNVIKLCKHLLAIKPDSLMALTVYADHLLQSIDQTNKNTVEFQTAYNMYEKVHHSGGKHSVNLYKLIYLSERFKNYAKFMEYSLENVNLRPTSPNYFILARAYGYLGKYKEGIEALKQARLSDFNYQNGEVSLSLINYLLRTASTKDHLMKCAKKFNNYLMLHTPRNSDLRISVFKELFKELKIEIPYFAMEVQREISEEKQSKLNTPAVLEPEKPNIAEQDDNWHVPVEIKAKILERLKYIKEAPVADAPQESKEYDPIAELQDGKIKLYSIGGNKSGLFAYMSPYAKTNSLEEAKKFKNVLKNGKLLTQDSQDESGVKPLSNGKFSNKPCGIERRMLTNGIFMADKKALERLRVNIPITGEIPDKVKILKFEPIKNHARLNK